MSSTIKASAFALSLLGFAAAGAVAQDAKPADTKAAAVAVTEVNFGIISTEATSNLKTVWEPFLKELEAGTGLKVNAFFASDYAGIIEGMRFNKVQLAWYGNKSAMEAVDRAEGEVFVQSVNKDGTIGYYSHLIVHKDSPITKLEDVLKCDKSLDFGIGDPNSTSGFLVPMTYVFAANKVDPKQCFKVVRNANHEANALAVANKQVQVAANNNENLERLKKTNPDALANIKVIWTSPLIPSDPLVWRKDLDAAAKTKIYTFLMGYGRTGDEATLKKQKETLAALGWSPFRPSSNAQLLPIRQLEVSRKQLKIDADDKLSADDKKKQLGEIEIETKKLADAVKAAETSDFTKMTAAFLAADAAGKMDDVKKMIVDAAAAVVKK
ncbi:MAG: phosphonate ABC transporter substrate-binding protein [Hyphomicrobiaceae bacterium]|nr:phosphonate ABC transporter substrate-binding protein [Hyphomicrobiaceae bacterium]